MRNHTRPLDHHRRSHYDTIRIGLKGKFNWELNNNHTVKLFYGHEEKLQPLSQLTQPKPNPISHRLRQPDDTQGVFVVKGETSRSHEIDEKDFDERLCESDRSGQPDNVCENTRVEQTHDRSGPPDERNSSSEHKVKEEDAREEHREIASFNTNNEFNREIKEEDIDINIPGLPHSTVKQLHGASVRELIQKIENHPHRQDLQRDLEQSQQLNPSSEESKELIHEVGNIELCKLLHMEPKAQCEVCLSYWDIGIVYCSSGQFFRNGNEENKKFVKYTMAPLREEARGSRILHRELAQEELQEERLLGYTRPVHSQRDVPQEYV